jgi:hypothetical protein
MNFRKLALMAIMLSLAATICQAGWIQWSDNGHWYTTSPDPIASWSEANAYASSLGGNLVSIQSQAENDWLQSTFFPVDPEAFWIGFREADPVNAQEVWSWSSGEPGTWSPSNKAIYANWAQPWEPSNHLNIEDFAVINWHFAHSIQGYDRGVWNDVGPNGCGIDCSPDSEPYRAIIERDSMVSDVPEPASFVLVGAGLSVAVALRRRRTA